MVLPRPFWFLWIGTLINRFGYFVIPFLTLYLVRHQGFDPATAGAVVSAFGAGSLVSQPLGGWLTDRVGRRPTLVAGMLATAAACLRPALLGDQPGRRRRIGAGWGGR